MLRILRHRSSPALLDATDLSAKARKTLQGNLGSIAAARGTDRRVEPRAPRREHLGRAARPCRANGSGRPDIGR